LYFEPTVARWCSNRIGATVAGLGRITLAAPGGALRLGLRVVPLGARPGVEFAHLQWLPAFASHARGLANVSLSGG
jgi:hypothetical protein